MRKKILGYSILILLFISLFIGISIKLGFIAACIIFGLTALIVSLVTIAILLIAA